MSVERVAALVGAETPPDRQPPARGRQCVEQLVANEFVFVAQTARIEDSVFVYSDRIVEAGAEGITGLAQDLGIASKAESAGAGNVFEITTWCPVEDHPLTTDDLGIKIDLQVQGATIIRLERSKGVVVANGNGADDLEKFFSYRLNFKAAFQHGRSERMSRRLGPKTVVASFGELHPALQKTLDAPAGAVAAEIYLDAIAAPRSSCRARATFAPTALQSVTRDFAFIVPPGISADALGRAIRGSDKDAITGVRLFDRFETPTA